MAKLSGVTRLTVYNQFGSRGGLLEAVFDDIAARGDLARLAEARDDPDPWSALDRVIEIVCTVWGSEPAIGRLQDAMALDREFAQVVIDRNERRRALIRSLAPRLRSGLSASQENDVIDLLFSATSYATFQSLKAGRSMPVVCDLLKCMCHNLVGLHDAGVSVDGARSSG